MLTKTCKHHGVLEEKDIYVVSCGYRKCRICQRSQQKKFRKRNPEKSRAFVKQWLNRNSEAAIGYKKSKNKNAYIANKKKYHSNEDFRKKIIANNGVGSRKSTKELKPNYIRKLLRSRGFEMSDMTLELQGLLQAMLLLKRAIKERL